MQYIYLLLLFFLTGSRIIYDDLSDLVLHMYIIRHHWILILAWNMKSDIQPHVPEEKRQV